MSSDNKSKSNYKSQNQGKRQSGRGGQGTGGYPKSAHRGGNDPKDVPMLRWGQQNNYREFKRLLTNYAGEKFGTVAYDIIELEKNPTVTPLDPKDYPDNDAFAVERKRMDYKQYLDKTAELEKQLPKLYSCMVSYLSQESLDAVKSEKGYAEARDKHDPFRLWSLIKATHRIDVSKSENQEVIKTRVRNGYQQVRQGAFESIIGYKERFDEALHLYNDYGNPNMDEKDVAMDFFTRLDEARYNDFKIRMLNDINMGLRKPPDNLNAMFQLAKNYVVSGKANLNKTSAGVVFNTMSADEVRGKNKTKKNKKDPKLIKSKDSNKEQSETEKKDPTEITCWECGELGHYKSKCPDLKKDGSTGEHNKVHLTTSELVFATGSPGFKWYEVLLDNQANISVVHPRLLTGLEEHNSTCSGISGLPFELPHVGELEGFFQCHSSPKLTASVLCQSDVEDKYKITYRQGHSYTVHLPGRDLVFKKRNKLYVGDMRDWDNSGTDRSNRLYHTEEQDAEKRGDNNVVDLPDSPMEPASEPSPIDLSSCEEEYDCIDNENGADNAVVMLTKDMTGLEPSQYTRAQTKRAEEAWELIRKAGYLSKQEAIELVQDGNIFGLKLTSQDIERAFELFGVPAAYVRGRKVSKTIARSPVDNGLRDERKQLVLYSDIMYMTRKCTFLVTLAEPLGLLMSLPLKSTSALEIGIAVLSQVKELRAHGYEPTVMYCDAQPGFAALRGQIQGIEIDVAGAGDHLDRIDAKIRRVKEIARSITGGLPWELPNFMIKDLVGHVITLTNMKRNTSSGNKVAARVAFSGRKPNYKKELDLAFGDYCEVYNPTSEVSDPLKSRTDPCIALRSSGNANGSWIFWNLKSDKRVVRTNWIKLKTDHLIIDAMNAMSKMAKAKPDQAQDDSEEPEEENQIGIKDENLEEVDNTYLQESPPPETDGSMLSMEEDAPNAGVSAPDEAVVRDNDAPEQPYHYHTTINYIFTSDSQKL